MIKRTLFILFFCVTYFCLSAQELVVDSLDTPPSIVETIDARWPQPKKALMWSIIPGAGQMYNKRWWRVPIVYAAFAVDVYFIVENTRYYNEFKQRVIDKQNGSGNDGGIALSALVTNRELANKRRQQAYLGLFAIYVLQSAEAFTDAHLRHFDVSDDLSFQLRPTATPVEALGGSAYGVGLTIPLIKSKPKATFFRN